MSYALYCFDSVHGLAVIKLYCCTCIIDCSVMQLLCSIFCVNVFTVHVRWCRYFAMAWHWSVFSDHLYSVRNLTAACILFSCVLCCLPHLKLLIIHSKNYFKYDHIYLNIINIYLYVLVCIGDVNQKVVLFEFF
jgi:hypothetical protein